LFKEIANELLEKGLAYRCFCTEQELEEARELALAAHQTPKYNRKCLYLSQEEIQAKLDAGIPYVLRVKMPDERNIE
jgi:glutamyl/glutaminyl-tRNA synthetase